jgi:LacI family transcriptional regulator
VTVTSHDVARLAGVSQPTVSRALRADGQVSARTRARVHAAAEQLGYVPSERGRMLATRATRQIAVVANIDNALYPQLMAPLHATFLSHGWRTVLLAQRDDESVGDERLIDGSVDGAILTTTALGAKLPEQLRRRGVPFVELNRTAGTVESDRVLAHNEAGGRAAAELLAAGGHRRIAAIFGPTETSSSQEREAGFRAGLRDNGVRLTPDRTRRGWFSEPDGRRAMHDLLSTKTRPTAVFCVSDMVAAGAMNALAEHGLSAPDDIAVVGFDDLAIAGWPVLSLTTVRVDFAAMAARAAELLIARIADPDTPYVHDRFPVELVRRRSHGG